MRKTLAAEKIDNKALEAINNFHPQVIKEIEDALAKNEWVIVGMAQNPFVKKARRLLFNQSINFHYIEHGSYFSKWRQRLAIKLWSGWPTYPQVFHRGILIGGFTDLKRFLEKKN